MESEYVNSQNKKQPCYEITKMGCEFVANKMTGVKGTAFTAKYVERFNKMEQVLKQPKLDSYMIENPIKRAEAWILEQKEKEQLQLTLAQKDQRIGELQPKADYMDSILKNKGLVTITQIAKDYGMSGSAMNELLHELEVHYKQSGQWLLYSKYHNKGYTHSETIPITHKDGRADVRMNTKWTQKGRVFIYNLLKDKKDILPVIEREENKAV